MSILESLQFDTSRQRIVRKTEAYLTATKICRWIKIQPKSFTGETVEILGKNPKNKKAIESATSHENNIAENQ